MAASSNRERSIVQRLMRAGISNLVWLGQLYYVHVRGILHKESPRAPLVLV